MKQKPKQNRLISELRDEAVADAKQNVLDAVASLGVLVVFCWLAYTAIITYL